jgi:hypothetical protein
MAKKLSKTNKDLFIMLADLMLANQKAKLSNAEKLDDITPEEKAAIQEVIDKLTALIAEVNAAEEVTEEEVMDKVEKLGKKFDLLANAYTVSTLGDNRRQMRETKRTLADAIKELKLKENKGNFVKLDEVELTQVTTNPTEQILTPRISVKGIYNYFRKSSTSVRSHKIISSTEDGAVVSVAVREKKPTLSIEFTEKIVNAEVYAGIYRGITDEDLEDFNWLATFIRERAKEKMNMAINLACYTLLNGSATAYANTVFSGAIKSPNYINAVNALVAQIKDEMGERTGRVIVAVNPVFLELINNTNNDNGTPIITPLGTDTVLVGDDNVTGTKVIGWAEDTCHISNYVTYGEEWGYSVKSDGGTAYISEWESDENSLKIRERNIIFSESADLIVKGDLNDILNDIKLATA